MNKAIVFNCHYNGLSIIQELGRNGISSIALDNSRSVGTFSRYSKYCRCPDASQEEDAFIEYLMEIGPLFAAPPVLFPTNDQWVVAISKRKQLLQQYYLPCVADYEVVKLLIEKRLFYDWGYKHGYPVPRSWSFDEIEKISNSSYPVVAKPEYRRIASNSSDQKKRGALLDKYRLTVFREPAELNSFYNQNIGLCKELIVQEYVQGLSDCMYTVGVYANEDHDVLGLFSGRKLRGYPPDVGDCVVGQAEDVPEEIKKLVREMCKHLSYRGIAEFEFKKDSSTGGYVLIEINPRSWSWVGITPQCNVSLPLIAYNDMVGKKAKPYKESTAKSGDVKYVKILDDFVNCLHKNKKAGYSQWHMSFGRWWKSIRASKVVFAGFAFDDPLPGIFTIYAFLRSIVFEFFRRVKK